jgi:hypothetical protein
MTTSHCLCKEECGDPKLCTVPQSRVRRSKEKMEKIKSNKVFPVKFNSQRVNLDLPVTQKIEPKQSEKERNTN